MIKESVQQENIKILNIYAPNMGAPKFIKQVLLDIRNEIHSKTIIVGDFSTPLTALDRSSRQKVNKQTMDLNYTLEQMDSTDIYRTFCPTEQLQKVHYFHEHMEHSPRQTIQRATEQVSTNLRKFRLYQVHSQTTVD